MDGPCSRQRKDAPSNGIDGRTATGAGAAQWRRRLSTCAKPACQPSCGFHHASLDRPGSVFITGLGSIAESHVQHLVSQPEKILDQGSRRPPFRQQRDRNRPRARLKHGRSSGIRPLGNPGRAGANARTIHDDGEGRGKAWRPSGGGEPLPAHWFTLRPGDERPLFAFAGIYRQWKGPIKKHGPNVDIEVFPFMTTLPNRLTETINHERSPVLLTEEPQYQTWLSGTPEEAFGLIKTSDVDRPTSDDQIGVEN